jgi:hypothetical protein
MDAAAIMHMRIIYLELPEHDVGGRVLQQEPLKLGLQALQLADVLLLLVNVLWGGWAGACYGIDSGKPLRYGTRFTDPLGMLTIKALSEY